MARFAERGLGILLVPLYARQLHDEGYGIVALFASVMPFVGLLFEQGLLSAWFRLRHNYPGGDERRTFEATIVWYLLASGFVLLTILTVLGPYWTLWISSTVPFFPLAFVTLLTGALQVYPNLYIRRANSDQQPLTAVTFTLPRTLLSLMTIAVGVAVFDLGPLGKIGAEALVTAIFATIALHRIRPANPRHFSRTILRDSLNYGLPLMPHTLTSQLNAMASRVLISRHLSLSATGVYSMGATIAEFGTMIAMSLNQSFSPLFISEMRQAERQSGLPHVQGIAASDIARTGLLMVAAVACVSLGLAAGARELLMLIATDKFKYSYQVVGILCASTVLRSSYFAFSQPLFYSSQAVRRMPFISGASAAVNIAGNLIMLPRLGFLGAAIASVLADLTLMLTALAFARAVLPLPYARTRWLLLYFATGSGLACTYALDMHIDSLVLRVLAKLVVLAISVHLAMACSGTSPLAFLRFLRTRQSLGTHPGER